MAKSYFVRYRMSAPSLLPWNHPRNSVMHDLREIDIDAYAWKGLSDVTGASVCTETIA
jgi:hypothetical protein